MSIFDEYCSEINDSLLKINSGISQYKISDDSSLLSELSVQYDGLVETIKQCDLEIRGHDSGERKRMTEVMSKYKTTLNNTKIELDSQRFKNQKGSLMGNTVADAKKKSESQKETLNRGNEMILNSLRLVAETEEFATQDIIPELQRNRDTLESAREKTAAFHGQIDTAKKTLDSMTRRHKTWGFF